MVTQPLSVLEIGERAAAAGIGGIHHHDRHYATARLFFNLTYQRNGFVNRERIIIKKAVAVFIHFRSRDGVTAAIKTIVFKQGAKGDVAV